MRTVVVGVMAAAAAATAGYLFGAAGAPKPERSPHGEAVELVLRTQADEVRKVDGGAAGDKWWHDVTERTWVVRRPFHPGVIDSTHTFDVTYRVGGKDVAMWAVDTRKGTAELFKPAAADKPSAPRNP